MSLIPKASAYLMPHRQIALKFKHGQVSIVENCRLRLENLVKAIMELSKFIPIVIYGALPVGVLSYPWAMLYGVADGVRGGIGGGVSAYNPLRATLGVAIAGGAMALCLHACMFPQEFVPLKKNIHWILNPKAAAKAAYSEEFWSVAKKVGIGLGVLGAVGTVGGLAAFASMALSGRFSTMQTQ